MTQQEGPGYDRETRDEMRRRIPGRLGAGQTGRPAQPDPPGRCPHAERCYSQLRVPAGSQPVQDCCSTGKPEGFA